MTLQTKVNKIVYNGLIGETVFAYSFRVGQKEDMEVYLSTVLLDEGEWTIDGLGNDLGGNVTLNDPLIEDATVTLLRRVDSTQLVDYQPFDAFPSQTHEEALDNLTMMVQQLDEEVDRAYKAPIDSAPGEDFSFPPYDPGKLLGWSETEPNQIENSPQTFADFVAEADRSEAAAENSETSAGNSATSAVLSQDFANEDEDVPVQGGLFSAKHYAIKALRSRSGLNLISIISGDDLCPKPGDANSPVACNAPDHRNPGERFDRTHVAGDYYLISAIGDMNLKDPGDPFGPETVQGVEVGDYIIFIVEIAGIIGEGFYRQEALGGGTLSADLVSMDDTSTAIKGVSVQDWNEAADAKITTAFVAIATLLDGLIGSVQSFVMNRNEGLWIFCNGQAISRATYSLLFAKVGVIYGNGDGSTTFNVPDYRGKILRATDRGAGVDPDAGARTDRGDGVTGDEIGTQQNGQMLQHNHGSAGNHQHTSAGNHQHPGAGSHNHTFTYRNNSNRGSTGSDGQWEGTSNSNTSNEPNHTHPAAGDHTHPATGDHTHSNVGGSENRMINVYTDFYIFTGRTA